MTTQTDIREAVAQPWKVYAAPEDVLADDTRSADEKRQILESWERDARELAVAEEENMGGGEPNMLGRVVDALNRVPPAEDQRPRGPATKHGSQPTPSSADSDAPVELSEEEARQGEVILRTRKRRTIFIAGLVLAGLVAVAMFFLAGATPPG